MRAHYTRTLILYDEPQVFEARDPIGGHYIAVLGVTDDYLVAGVAPARLRAFCDGKVDLRSLVLESEAESRYLAPELPPDGVLALRPFDGDLEGYLPAPDLVLDDLPSAELEGRRPSTPGAEVRRARQRSDRHGSVHGSDPPDPDAGQAYAGGHQAQPDLAVARRSV